MFDCGVCANSNVLAELTPACTRCAIQYYARNNVCVVQGSGEYCCVGAEIVEITAPGVERL
jgi:hypothetical protein